MSKKRHTLRNRFSKGGVINLERMFPEKVGVNYSNLKMTPEGEYSITKRGDSKKIIEKMKELIGSLKKKHITDLTGNVGGDTISFAIHFGFTDSIEIDNDNFDALNNNVKVFKLKNVRLHHGDSTSIFNWKTDVLYLDPPWGGPDYKDKENLDLFLGKQRIDIYLKEVLSKDWRPTYIFMKLPRNYNFDRLLELPNLVGAHKFPIRGFFLVGLKIKTEL